LTTGTRYARSGDADIAYRVYGDGPIDIVLSYDWGTHLEALSEQPLFEAFVQALARFSRVLWFDMRGIGMSSPVVGDPPIEWWMDDLVAVMDAGAYFIPNQTNFSNPRPAVVMVEDGTATIIRERESFEDIVARDHFS